MTTLVIVPTLGRLARLGRVLDNIEAATPEPHTVVFVVEDHEYGDTYAAVGDRATVLANKYPGHYGAYNWALEVFDSVDGWDAWVHAADDLNFHPGWLTLCRDLLDDNVVGTNDLLAPAVACGTAATHYLVARSYVAANPLPDVEPPHAYFTGYHHLCGETEFIDHARESRRFHPCLDAIVEHVHWLNGKAEMDATYVHAESRANADRALYATRKA